MSDPVNDVAILFGVLLLLKKVAEMERFFSLRIFLITVVLCYIAIVLFVGPLLQLVDPYVGTCMPEQNDSATTRSWIGPDD